MRVAVVGAGIVGMTSALHIMEDMAHAQGQVQLTVISEKYCPDNTSYGSGGNWKPPSQEHMSTAELRWLQWSFDYLTAVIRTDYAHEMGVFLQSGYVLHADSVPDPAWKDIVVGFRHLTKWELQNLFPGYKQGWFYTGFICQPRDFLPWAHARLSEKGAVFLQRRVQSFEELAPNFDVIVNCTGLEASALTEDKTVFPARGQVMRIEAPWFRHFVGTHGQHPTIKGNPYIIPNLNDVVIGGIKQDGNHNVSNDPRDSRTIWEGVLALYPQLKGAEVIEEWTGLRPMREGGIRLERETLIDSKSGRSFEVIHNYGHGANGVTWSHGCAREVAEMLKVVIAEKAMKSRL